jgi:hypothetical protein
MEIWFKLLPRKEGIKPDLIELIGASCPKDSKGIGHSKT